MLNFFAALVLFCGLSAGIAHAQTESTTPAQPQGEDGVADQPDCSKLETTDPQGEADPESQMAQCVKRQFPETLPASSKNAKTVEAELAEADRVKSAIFPVDVVHDRLQHFYSFKERISDTFKLDFSIDYTLLTQRASFTEGETNTGSSSVFRILGTWLRIGDPKKTFGTLVWKTETRNPIWGNITPRDLGFTTGSALSTANFKSLPWGITDLYWKQRINGGRLGLLVGHMDPGDWADQYPLLNAWTSFMSDAFYNNPTEAIPKRGFGIAGQIFFKDDFYLAGGVHDANGGDGDLDFESFWSTREWFSWIELGRRSSTQVASRHNTHVHYWHQDRREEAGTGESRGIAFTYSLVNERGGVSFLRAGFSRGGAAQMRRFVGAGMSWKPLGRDTLGIAASWGSPPEKDLRNQLTGEIFYRLQVTQNLTLTPNLQATLKPSYTLATNWVLIPGFRMRFVF